MRLMWQAVIFATLLVITAPMQASAEDAETAPTGGTLTMEPNINLFGGDYANFKLAQAVPELCRSACAADGRCLAYSYVNPGAQFPEAHCWLKSTVPPRSLNGCCVSGVKDSTSPSGAQAHTAADIDALNRQTAQLSGQGKYPEATVIAQQALRIAERVLGKDHSNTLQSVSNLADLYEDQGRYGDAEPLYKRLFEAKERLLGEDHPHTFRSAGNLALLYFLQGRYGDAEPLYKRAWEASERVFGKEHPDTLISLNNLAEVYRVQGRYAEAEPLYKRVIEAQERVLSKEHLDTLLSVNNLALLYNDQGRYSEAEPLLKRVLGARERQLGKEHPETLKSISNLASLYARQDRYAEAEPLYKRALEVKERVLGKEHPDTLSGVLNLASLYSFQGRYGEAEPLLKRALEAQEHVIGKEHPETLASVNNLAGLYCFQGRYDDAEPLYKRALEASERVFGKEHPNTLTGVHNLALLYFEQRDWVRAAQLWRRGTAALAKQEQRGAKDVGQAVAGKRKSEMEQFSWQFRGLVKVEYRIAPQGRAPDAATSREMFQTAQWAAGSEAAQSLAQMAARGASGNPALAVLARERQDLVQEWQKRDGLRNGWLGQAPDRRDTKAEAEINARLAAINARIGEIDKQLTADFPDYAALASPAPLSVEEVQAQLRPDEAVILFLDTPEWRSTPEETFIWVLTKTDVHWVRSGLGTPALKREVAALRCGLDAEAWTSSGAAQCAGLLNMPLDKAPKDGRLLPFDLSRSHALYKALFGEAEDLIRGKSLIVVPSGPLTQLPFQVLVTKPATPGDYKSATWLVREHALSVLPAVSSLKALRRIARPSAATKPMIGFGSPLLDGDQGDPKYGAYFKKLAALARENQSCPKTPLQRLAALFGLRRGVAPMAVRGLADVALLRAQLPLPETRDELCAVARDLNADPGEMRLGARATEREVKRLSASGALAQYRIVHFATHGVLAGQLDPKAEPGLILTPPETASEEDDGYLTASEVAALKLDSDWVILSACNTAAAGATGAEALSGLARAFFYAQARALLVSHWEVDSAATVKLITGAVSETARDRTVGRSEALRRAMLALVDNGKPYEAHPAYWAPFVLVGEGATMR